MTLPTFLKLLLAIGAVAAAWQVGLDRIPAPAPAGSSPLPDAPATSRPVPVNGQMRGMAIQLHGRSDLYEHYRNLVPEVANLGADTVMFVVHGIQDHAGSLDLHIDGAKTADVQQLGRLLDLATAHGLRVILMPIVLLANPRNNEWRGQIIPPQNNWDAWFNRYSRFILHFADVAERHKVSVFMVGSELIKAEGKTAHWRRLIADVRRRYHGQLGYSANWDHYHTDKIEFWPDLDVVGMTSYYQLADGPNPSMSTLEASWLKIKKDIEKFHRVVNKPILFTEAGWCSQEGAAKEAWNYYHNQKATEAGHREQAACYEAFMNAWSNEPYVGGIIWWEWDNTPGGKDDYNYTPRGKIAEGLLRMWFASKRPPVAAEGVLAPPAPAPVTDSRN